MPSFPFYKFSPSGNTTLFLLGAINSKSSEYCRLALLPETVPAEQCAMADIKNSRLQMGGGEFCANACRAFGAMLAMEEAPQQKTQKKEFKIHASGSSEPVHVIVQGHSPSWFVEAVFSLRGCQLKKLAPNAALLSLPGITHLLLTDSPPDLAQLPRKANELRKLHNLEECEASGIVWWNEDGGALSILPHISVPLSGTAMLESSCGSASLALAFSLKEATGRKNFIIRQPGGANLSISLLDNDKALLGGDVQLCAKGEIYLPDL